MSKLSKWLIGIGLVLLALLVGFTGVISISNGEISKNQAVVTAKANISKEEQRRVDLFSNLADSIESYNKHESEVQKTIANARTKAGNGKIEEAAKTLNVVVEKYPDLKSQKNYQTAMQEFSVTENRLSNYRENYNADVRDYNLYTHQFPKKQILSLMGNDVQNYKPLNYNVNNSKATNLFK